MSTRRRAPGYMTEDLQMRIISGPPSYTTRTDGPVDHVMLRTTTGEVMGYIYVNDDDDAAGWIPLAGASPHAQNLAAFWIRILRDLKGRERKPSEALAQALTVVSPHFEVVAESRQTSANLEALKILAGRTPRDSGGRD